MDSTPTTLVIGGTGLVGSHLLWLLTQEGPVIATGRSEKNRQRVAQLFSYYSHENGPRFFKNIHWLALDVLDVEAVTAAVQGMKQVYHCAALVSFHRIDFYTCIKVNREGTANVVNACLNVPNIRLCYVSSTAALGINPSGSITESCLWKASDKNSGYSISKFGAEKEVWRGMEEWLDAVIINPCTVIGAGAWGVGSMELFSVAEKGLLFYPNGSNATVDARDVAKSMVFLMASGIQHERFLCTGTNKDFKSLFTSIAEALGKRGPRFYAPKSLAIPIAYLLETLALFRKKRRGMTIESAQAAYSTRIYDSSKLKALVNAPFYSLEDSINNCIAGRIK